MIITLKDGSIKEYESQMSVYDIARDISEGLARMACVGEVDGRVVDLRTVVDRDAILLRSQSEPATTRSSSQGHSRSISTSSPKFRSASPASR